MDLDLVSMSDLVDKIYNNMKNTFLIALFLCSTSLSAQSNGPGQVVKANPFEYA